jgi:hypothetical protein
MIASSVLLVACRLFVSLDGLTGGEGDAGADVRSESEPAVPPPPPPPNADDAQARDGDAAEDGGADGGDASKPPIAYVSTSTALVTTNSTSLDLATPTGAVAGDVEIVGLFTDGDATNATTPNGFTKISDLPSSASGIHGWWYFRAIGTSEPAKTTFRYDSTGFASAIGLLYRNVRVPNPVDSEAFALNGANPIVAPTITTDVTNTRLIAIFLGDDSVGATWTTPGGMTARGGTGIAAAFDEEFPTTGMTGPRATTNSLGAGAVSGLIAIAPAQ